MIRLARPDDLPRLAAIERSAASRFHGTHMAFAADHPTTPADALVAALAQATLWIGEADGAVAGFLLAEPVDRWLHLLEMSVAADAQGRGLGSGMIEAAAMATPAFGCDRLSLTTDRTLAWNAPFYARRGFVEVPSCDQPDWLAGILRREAAHGLKPEWRIAMVRPL